MTRLIAVLLAASALAGCAVPLADDEEAWSRHTPATGEWLAAADPSAS